MKKMIKRMAMGLVALSLAIAFSSAPTIVGATGSTQTVAEFQYIGDVQTWTVPQTGTYKLETWGAAGGDAGYYSYSYATGKGGHGGYSAGEVSLTGGQTVYVYVGGQGGSSVGSHVDDYNFFANGGWNGGGAGNQYGMTGGGGATDIRISGQDLNDRKIVAGGGGGAGNSQNEIALSSGGAGGGLEGEQMPSYTQFEGRTAGLGGTQTGGYALGMGESTSGNNLRGGGGGGYYGGRVGDNSTGGGGGSGYIGGVKNGIAIVGNTSMPSPYGDTQIGQTGNGFAKITLLGQQQSDLTGITISDRSIRLPLGSVTQVYVTAQYSDGSTRDITNQATYKSSNTNVITAGAAGYISTNGRGSADLTVNYKEKTRAGTTKAVSARVKVAVY